MDYKYINEIRLPDEYFRALYEHQGVPFRRLPPKLPTCGLGYKKKVCRINIENPEETYLMEKKH